MLLNEVNLIKNKNLKHDFNPLFKLNLFLRNSYNVICPT